MSEKSYLIIDLKSFYASVECADRGLDCLTTNLVVADKDRSRGTICLAITPSMKAQGIKNRCRIFEIPDSIDYIIAPPRMKRYIEVSANIYELYLGYVAKEDIYVYSIDEAWLDVTDYLELYSTSAHDLALRIMGDIEKKFHLRATCGIGTNMYLAKVALDILAKHSPDFVAELDEDSYKKRLWKHTPLTDFWRVGPGTVKRLSSLGLYTQEDIAKAPAQLLYKHFGAPAEYMIDHAWGIEPCTISDIKNYTNKSHSLSCGQVLMRDYNYEDALIIVKEMANELVMDMVNANVVSCTFTLHVGFSKNSLPSVNGSSTIQVSTNSVRIITDTFADLYKKLVPTDGLIRRMNLTANNIVDECYEQYSFFVDPQVMENDRKITKSVNDLKTKFGNNAILKGMDLLDAATQQERNRQIGGHKSGE